MGSFCINLCFAILLRSNLFRNLNWKFNKLGIMILIDLKRIFTSNSMYKALYRKYRPEKFCDVVGQGYITTILENEVKSGKIAHAYLFIGPRGTGKTTCARIFSKAINCLEKDPLKKPCGICNICKSAGKETLTDITELDAASNNGVNDIREICEFSKFTPNICKYKIYIIDEVHMLSTGAFNALLKTLEEPPNNVVFLLATTEVQKIPATILSRCQKFEFKKISIEDIAKRLSFVAEKEGINIDEDSLKIISQYADGAMRDALSILDKCTSAANGNVTKELVSEVLMVADYKTVSEICESIIHKDLSTSLCLVNKLDSGSTSLINTCTKILEFFRNLMLIKANNESGNDNLKKIINKSDEEYKRLENITKFLDLKQILKILDYLQECAERIPYSMDAKLCLESFFIKINNKLEHFNIVETDTDFNSNEDDLFKRLENLEKKISSLEYKVERCREYSLNNLDNLENLLNSNEVTNKGQNISKDKEETKPIMTEINKSDIKKNGIYEKAKPMPSWNAVLEKLKKMSQSVYTAFKDSKAYVSGQYVLIDSKSEIAFELLKKSVQRDKIRAIIEEVTGVSYRLGPYKHEDARGGSAPDGVSLSEERDPLKEFINKAIDLGIDVTVED